MAYEFEEPFILDTSKYEGTFGAARTPLPAAITATVAWYRDRAARSSESQAPTGGVATDPATAGPATGLDRGD